MFQTFFAGNVVGMHPEKCGTFNSTDVTELTGITSRQLQWLDERGIVVPKRSGRSRAYALCDLAEIAVICDLRRKGFSLQRVRKVIKYLQRELGKRLVETVTEGADYHLLTDGRRIFLENSEKQIVDILKNSRQPVLALCLSDTIREVRADIRASNARVTKVRGPGPKGLKYSSAGKTRLKTRAG